MAPLVICLRGPSLGRKGPSPGRRLGRGYESTHDGEIAITIVGAVL
jgi:hypothetical protein